MGDALATEVQRVLDEHNISVDVVIPVRRYRLNEILAYTQALHLGARHISRCCTEPGAKTEPPLPRRIHQESIRRTNIHHAWSTDEVSRVQASCRPHLIPNVPQA